MLNKLLIVWLLELFITLNDNIIKYLIILDGISSVVVVININLINDFTLTINYINCYSTASSKIYTNKDRN